MKLPIAEVVDAPIHGGMSGNEVVARNLIKNAVDYGQLSSIEMILDRIEGRPTKAAANKPDNSQLTEQRDVQIESLNDLAKDEP